SQRNVVSKLPGTFHCTPAAVRAYRSVVRDVAILPSWPATSRVAALQIPLRQPGGARQSFCWPAPPAGASEAEALAIRPVPRGFLIGVESELGKRVPVPAMLVLRVASEEPAHALLGGRRDPEAEVIVDRAHGADRVPQQIEVAHVEEAIRRNQAFVSRAQRA